MSSGILNSAGLVAALTKPSIEQVMTSLMPSGNASMFALTSAMSSETAIGTEHAFSTTTMIFPQMVLSAAAAATDTILSVTASLNIIPGQAFLVDTTQERVIIDSVISPTQVRVTRGVGSTPTVIALGVSLWNVGNAYEEGSLRPQALAINPVRISNLTQIFRNTWAITESARATAMLAGDTNVVRSKQDCIKMHGVSIEQQLLFGAKSNSFRNGQPMRTLDGLISIVSNLAYYPSYFSAANVYTAGATTNWTQLEGMLDPCFSQSSDPGSSYERILYVGAQARKVINNIGRLNSTYYMENGETSYGLQFSTFKTTRGQFTVMEHPLLAVNPSFSKMAIAVDLKTLGIAYLAGRTTTNKDFNPTNGEGATEAVDNGIDSTGGTLTTECTLIVRNPPANAVMYNLTSAAVG
jgi:hypothetical protein